MDDNVINFPGAAQTDVIDRRLSDAELVPHITAEAPSEAATTHAGKEWDAANATLRRNAEVWLTELAARKAREAGWIAQWTTIASARLGLKYDRDRVHDRAVRPTLAERGHNLIYVILRYLLLAATVGLIGVYVRASDYNAALSSDILWSTLFGLPVILLSGAISVYASSMDELADQRRLADRLTHLGTFMLAIWIVATAILFGLSGGTAGILKATIGGGANTVDPGPLAFLKALFPDNMTGKVLLASHVCGEVLIAAAWGVRAKLFHATGRTNTAKVRQDGKCALDEHDLMQGREDAIAREIARHEALLAGIADGREAALADAQVRMARLVAERDADTACALVNVIRRHTKVPIAAE